MTLEEIRARLLMPAGREEVEAAWAEIFRAADWPRRRVEWAECPADARRIWLALGDRGRDFAWGQLYDAFTRATLYQTDGEFPRVEIGEARAVAGEIFWLTVWGHSSLAADTGDPSPGGAIIQMPYAIVGASKWKHGNPWQQFLTIWSGAGLAWVLRDRVLCVPHPSVRRDDSGRTHADDGPAVTWAGREDYFFWHGVRVPPSVVLFPGEITAAEVLAERNAEVRRVMIERMTAERFVAQAKGRLLDRDTDRGGERSLRRIRMNGDEPMTALVVRCPSTRAVHILRVPPRMRTCRQAAAWTFGYRAVETYCPSVET